MIPKASQRGGGQQLATHLLNELENDRVEVMEVRGAVANDLHGAFAEWAATATGTKCRKYLYSLSINPDPAHGALTREQYLDFMDRVETKMGLSAQPRAVVFHVKHGREHAHVVWSRIDHEHMKAVHMAHDRQKLRAVTQEFAQEHGLRLPRGMRNNRGLERFNDHANGVSLAEKQQEERTGLTKDERRRTITAAWRQHEAAKRFVHALASKGFVLARGQRGYVLVDAHGEIHSLVRQIEGVNTKEVKARLTDHFPLDHLREARQVQEELRDRDRNQLTLNVSDAFRKHAVNQWAILKQKQEERRAALLARHKAITERHQAERTALLAAQKKERIRLVRQQEQERPKGWRGFWGKLTGKEAALKDKHIQQRKALKERQSKAANTLAARQRRASGLVTRHLRALASVEKREARSLSTALHRRQLVSLTQAYRTAQKQPQKDMTQEFSRAAQPSEIGRPAWQESGPSPVPPRAPATTREVFRQAGQEKKPPAGTEKEQPEDRLTEAFRRAKKQQEKRERQKGQDRDPGRGMGR